MQIRLSNLLDQFRVRIWRIIFFHQINKNVIHKFSLQFLERWLNAIPCYVDCNNTWFLSRNIPSLTHKRNDLIKVVSSNIFEPYYIYEVHTTGFQTFFVWALSLIVHTWNSSPLRSNLLRLQCTCTVPTTSWWKCYWADLMSAGLFRRNFFLNSLKTST